MNRFRSPRLYLPVVAGVALALLFASLSSSAHESMAASGQVPVLGHPWGGYQEGYGQPHPANVSNGGDPTGQVRRIKWSSWGNKTAIGTGVSTYVWPGTGVANNPPIGGARIVAFHLGTCHGQLSYNAVEWYFPRYGDSFDARNYINACTGAYVGPTPKLVACRNIPISGTPKTATNVYVMNLTCATARGLIARSPAARFVPPRQEFIWHFMESGYRCGTAGDGRDTSTPPSYECERHHQQFLFDLRVR
jgi:hypothetical protein